MNKIQILVADDEKLAREGISLLLSKLSDVSVIKECNNGKEAFESIINLQPDIVFLDVQMPLMNGFEVVRALDLKSLPLIIFVTAFDKHAIEAFEVNAIDYLLKPFTDDRFFQAFEKAKKRLIVASEEDQNTRINFLIEHLNNQENSSRTAPLKRIMVKDGNKIVFIQIDDIRWIEASDYYVKLHLENKMYLIRETMAYLEDRLDQNLFARIHRSNIVNVDAIKEIHPYGKDDYNVILKDNTTLKMGRNWFKKLETKLGRYYS